MKRIAGSVVVTKGVPTVALAAGGDEGGRSGAEGSAEGPSGVSADAVTDVAVVRVCPAWETGCAEMTSVVCNRTKSSGTDASEGISVSSTPLPSLYRTPEPSTRSSTPSVST